MSAAVDARSIRFVICDLDGVVWLDRRPIPGSVDAIERLRRSGRRVLFATNNSMSLVADQEAALAEIGVPAVGDVITSAQAAAGLVEPGERTLVCGEAGVVEAVVARGATVVDGGPVDVVVVGLNRRFDYELLDTASRAIRSGARFVATNDDATFPTPDGPVPGAGSLVAAVATASGVRPEIAGKPHSAMAALARERCGPDLGATTALVVGDRWSTDGRFAAELGCPFALVRSGVTAIGADLDDSGGALAGSAHAAIDAADLAAVVDELVGPPGAHG